MQATDGTGEETTRNIKVAASATADNTNIADLVTDVNNAITAAGLDDVVASETGGSLTFKATDGSALLIPHSLFADPITVTTEHCYEHWSQPAGWVYVKLLSDMELAAAHGEGLCPTSLPAEHSIYYR